MSHEILQNALRAVHDIDIPPVNPRVIGLESRVQQVITSTTNRLATGPLSRKGVSLLHAHLDISAKVLLDDCGTAEADLLVSVVLDAIQLRRKSGQGVILAIAHQECQVDQFMRICQLVQEVEVFLEVGGGVAEGGEDEDTFAIGHGLGGGLDRVQVDFGDAGAVHFVGFVVVEEDRSLGVGVPLNHLIEGHFHRRFRGAIAVETGESMRVS